GDDHAPEGEHQAVHEDEDEPAGRAAHDDVDDDEDAPGEGRGDGRGRGGRRERGRRGKPARHRVRARIPIDQLLKKGQMVAVQITKDAIGDKGPTLTTYISIPGRYLVLMPSLERTGVSRKIDDEKERRRLKRILQSLDIPEGMGVIVRTAGVGRSKLEIKRDLEYLLLAWEDFSKRLRSGRNPSPLYQESDVAIRTMRDLFTPDTESVIVDDPEVFQRVVEFTKRLMPEHLERVRMHEGERPLFHSHGVEQDFEKIFARRVELPSGGSIVIEQTEALVAIDVNSGRTREEGAEFEDIALKTNLEATPEIARQIRLRDLGGIIVLDYIDMMRAGSRRAVERATREALKADRARAKIGRISQFGLLELTRQRLGPGLSKLVYDPCPRCRGSGRRRNASSRAQAIMRRLAHAQALKGYTTVEVRTHPDVIEYLETELKVELAKLQERSGREIKLLAVPEQVEDSVLHYLRADGREVRPGGRRRR
ncbi:MAG: Rne/Rng family ribonuclease, partial [Planctomycetota bacterium]